MWFFDYVGHVDCAAVADFEIVSVEDLVELERSIKRRNDFATFV